MTDSESIPPILVVTGGPQDGATIACDTGEEKVLGSGAQAHLRLTGGNVAATHARLAWSGEHLLLTDDVSATGTFVNGEKIQEPYPLTEGDRVYLGPPGSPDSVSLLVCPPVDAKNEPLLLEPPAPSFTEEKDQPLVLDAPAVAPAFDFLAPPPPPSAKPAPPPPVGAADPVTTIPLKPVPGMSPPPPKKTAKPEYTSDMPSIGGDRVREPVRLPPAARTPVKKPAGGGGLSRLLIPGAVVVLLAGAGVAYWMLAKSPPVLLSLGAPRAEVGGTLTLTGERFAPEAAGNTVRFGQKSAQVVSASPTELQVRIPADAAAGVTPVTVETAGGRSSPVNCELFQPPALTTLEPGVALPGAEVAIHGKHLSGEQVAVSLGGREAEILPGGTNEIIRFRVPADLPIVEGKSVPVKVRVGAETAAKPLQLMLGRLPLLAEIGPASAPAGSRVTLKGFGFAADPGGNVVRFGSKQAVVVSAKPTEIVAVAPGADVPGSQVTVDVRVETAGSMSAGRPFILTRSSAGTFTPRFYPERFTEHPGHDHVFIATGVGPLLVLTGKGDPASSAARAAAVADALNVLADTAMAGKPAGVELREKPAPCVAAVGGADCLVTVTPEDVAAYDEKWAADKSARPTARAVAAHWAALIEDTLMLFLHKQRPYRVLEISPRGKVLLEIYGEAGRKIGPGRGVPTTMVSPLPSRWAAALKDMALVIAGEGQARGGAAIEGVWAGKVNDGTTNRDVLVTFRMEDGKPAGKLTTRRGKLAMDVPLSEISYDRGAVRFVAAWAGKPTTFEGTLKQGVLSGNLLGPAKQAAGTFSLSFVE